MGHNELRSKVSLEIVNSTMGHVSWAPCKKRLLVYYQEARFAISIEMLRFLCKEMVSEIQNKNPLSSKKHEILVRGKVPCETLKIEMCSHCFLDFFSLLDSCLQIVECEKWILRNCKEGGG